MKAETLLPLGKLDPGLRAPDTGLDLTRTGRDANTAERLGYHTILMEETKHDPFQVLALAAVATRSAHIGTSVAIAFARSPFVIAQAAWTLQELSQGRFELGLGSQVRGHIQRRFGLQWHPPGPWMRDYVGAVRAIWSSWQTGTPLHYESFHYNLNLNVPLFTPPPIEHPNIPIQIAAVNPYMCRVAAEIADGVRLHPVCTRKYITDVLAPAMAPFRQPSFEVCLKPLIATARDEATLAIRKEIARQRLAFYCSTPGYARAFSIYGLEDLCAELASLSKKQQWNAMASRINDDLLQEFVVVALYDDLAEAIDTRYGDCVDRIEVSIPVESEQDQQDLASIVRQLDNGS